MPSCPRSRSGGGFEEICRNRSVPADCKERGTARRLSPRSRTSERCNPHQPGRNRHDFATAGAEMRTASSLRRWTGSSACDISRWPRITTGRWPRTASGRADAGGPGAIPRLGPAADPGDRARARRAAGDLPADRPLRARGRRERRLALSPRRPRGEGPGRAAAARAGRGDPEAGGHPALGGRAIIATVEPHQVAVLEAIRELGAGVAGHLQQGSVMVLPRA